MIDGQDFHFALLHVQFNLGLSFVLKNPFWIRFGKIDNGSEKEYIYHLKYPDFVTDMQLDKQTQQLTDTLS